MSAHPEQLIESVSGNGPLAAPLYIHGAILTCLKISIIGLAGLCLAGLKLTR